MTRDFFDFRKKEYNISLSTLVDEELNNELEDYLINNQHVFQGKSHFIRCAIIEKLRPDFENNATAAIAFIRWMNKTIKNYMEEKKEW